MDLATALSEVPVVAILRSTSADTFVDATHALVDAGIRAVELTLTTPGALDALTRIGRVHAACVGAGTVLSPDDARAAVGAGAEFLVAPATDPETLAVAGDLQVPMLAGAFTPTEILAAWRAGSTMVKVFPAVLGPAYVRALTEPMPDVPLVATGGVSIEMAPQFIAAGAAAVGLGGSLLGQFYQSGDLAALHDRARNLVKALTDRRIH